jgi:hypothetical protein
MVLANDSRIPEAMVLKHATTWQINHKTTQVHHNKDHVL